MRPNKKPKTYSTARKYIEEVLKEESFEYELDTMIAIFADCYEGLTQERVEINGNPKGSTEFLEAKQFLKIGKYLPQYNNFDPSMLPKLVEIFGESARYAIAREGSVCIYVKLTDHRVWLSGHRGIVKEIEALQVDEFSVEVDNGHFRLWWD